VLVGRFRPQCKEVKGKREKVKVLRLLGALAESTAVGEGEREKGKGKSAALVGRSRRKRGSRRSTFTFNRLPLTFAQITLYV
jgi:hypothetical protein